MEISTLDKLNKVPCKTPFSNGTEFQIFLDKCCTCTKYRNEKCRIIIACYKAMFDQKHFPFDDLLEWENHYGGKFCKHYTTEHRTVRRKPKQTTGQIGLFV